MIARQPIGQLWLAGVFPDRITARVQRRGAPPIAYYDELGAAGFRSAATMDLALRHGLGDVFLRAADQFTHIRSALNGLSDAHVLRALIRAAADGVRVDLVTCTDGAEGEIHDPTLDQDLPLPVQGGDDLVWRERAVGTALHVAPLAQS